MLIQKHPHANLADLSLEPIKQFYGEHEIEHRVKSVSIGAWDLAEGDAMQFEKSYGGVILGLDINEDYLRQFCLINQYTLGFYTFHVNFQLNS